MLRNGVPPEEPEGFDKIQDIKPEPSVKTSSSRKTTVSASQYAEFLAWKENRSVSGKSKSSHLSLTSQAALAAKDKEMEERLAAKNKEMEERLAAKDKEIAEQLAAKNEETKEFLRENVEQIKAALALQLQRAFDAEKNQLQAAFDAEKKRLEDDLQQQKKARLQQESAQKA